jgi:hypothetical protein
MSYADCLVGRRTASALSFAVLVSRLLELSGEHAPTSEQKAEIVRLLEAVDQRAVDADIALLQLRRILHPTS